MDQGKILITEDEESLRFVLQKALETEGYWVQTAANGASARRLLTDSHFDISLMDIKLPDVDGLDLLKEIKENGTDTAMILMTAQNTMRNAIGAMKNGAFDYITKPFDLDEVLVLVKRAMDSRKLSRDFRELKEEVKKRFEQYHRHQPEHASRLQNDRSGRRYPRDDLDFGRERHRQGTRCQNDPL
jgi:two-component system nitrogen regulation response regulator GlnG